MVDAVEFNREREEGAIGFTFRLLLRCTEAMDDFTRLSFVSTSFEMQRTMNKETAINGTKIIVTYIIKPSCCSDSCDLSIFSRGILASNWNFKFKISKYVVYFLAKTYLISNGERANSNSVS